MFMQTSIARGCRIINSPYAFYLIIYLLFIYSIIYLCIYSFTSVIIYFDGDECKNENHILLREKTALNRMRIELYNIRK